MHPAEQSGGRAAALQTDRPLTTRADRDVARVAAETRLIPRVHIARARPLGRLPFGFSRRFFLFLLIGFVWLGSAWWAPEFAWVMVAWDALLLLVWMFDARQLPHPDEIEIRRVWTAPVALSTPSHVRIELRNHGRTPIEANLTDDVPVALRREPPELPMAAAEAKSAIAPGQGVAEYEIVPLERGNAKLGNVFLRYEGPFRVADRRAVASLEQTVRVYPNLEESKRNLIYLIRSRQMEQERRLKRRRGIGREFESLREYRDGDEVRDICWTAAARRGKLITKVYQVERSQNVWVVLDAGRLLRARPDPQTSLSKLDHACNAALGLAQVALYSGDRVGFLAYGRRVQQRLDAGRGTPHLRALVEQLSLVAAEPYEANHVRAAQVVLSVQKQRALVVWITDLAETAATPDVIESAALMANRHLVLFVVLSQPELAEMAGRRPADAVGMYRYVAAEEMIQRRELFLRRLRQQGALTAEVEPRRLSLALVNQYLEIKERSLI